MDLDVSDAQIIATRRSLHSVAEHVMAAQQYQSKARIGLRQETGGFATQRYPFGSGERRVRVVGVDLVVEDDDLRGDLTVQRQPITTLGRAGELLGITGGMPSDVYTPVSEFQPEAELVVDPTAARTLANFYALAQAALTLWTSGLAADEPSAIQLWPEHFDLATTVTEVNYGASAGDDQHTLPYLYVGPWAPVEPGGFWNEPFGASLALDDLDGLDAVGQALDFFRRGRLAAQAIESG